MEGNAAPATPGIESSETWKERTLSLGGSFQHFGPGYCGEIMGSMVQEVGPSFVYGCERVSMEGSYTKWLKTQCARVCVHLCCLDLCSGTEGMHH